MSHSHRHRRNPGFSPRTLQVAEWSAIAGVGVAGFFNAFLPTPYEIREEITVGPTDVVRHRVRDLQENYVKAGVGSVILSLFSSLAVGSAVPALVGGVTALGMTAAYEHAVPSEFRLLGSGTRRSPCLSANARQPIIEGIWREITDEEAALA